jgi:hypothetical protein
MTQQPQSSNSAHTHKIADAIRMSSPLAEAAVNI